MPVKEFHKITLDLDAHSLWKKIFIYRHNEFKHFCLMAEMVFSFPASNLMVERVLILLTLLLLDKQLSLKHEIIKSLIKINLSDKICIENGKNEILERAFTYVNSEKKRLLNHQQRKLV